MDSVRKTKKNNGRQRKPKMRCRFCGESRFRTAGKLSCHVSKNHAEFACTCFRRYTTEEELQAHKKETSDNAKKYGCSKCCRSFSTMDALHQHQRAKRHWKEGERKKAQEDCGKWFCHDSCGRSYSSKNGLKHHIASLKRDEDMKRCYDCFKPFADSARLDQHQKDTNHKTKMSPGQNNHHANAYYNSKVKVDPAEKKEAVREVNDTVNAIMDHVRSRPCGEIYSSDVRNAGSHAAKTKIGKPNEFDKNIPLNLKGVEEDTNGKVDYRYKEPPNTGHGVPPPNNMNVPREIEDVPKPNQKDIEMGYAVIKTSDSNVPAHLTHNGQLCPFEVKRDFYARTKKAIEELGLKDKVHLSPLAHGPAITLTIKWKYDINVDLVATCGSVQPVSINGWPRPDTKRAFSEDQINAALKAGLHHVPKYDTTWYRSFSKVETALFNALDQGNGCRKKALKWMKKFVGDAMSRSSDGLPGISSHLLKNQILWSSERHHEPDHWHERNFHERQVDTMEEFENSLRSGKLPSYFNTSENLLAGKDRDVLNRLADQMRDERMRLIHMNM